MFKTNVFEQDVLNNTDNGSVWVLELELDPRWFDGYGYRVHYHFERKHEVLNAEKELIERLASRSSNDTDWHRASYVDGRQSKMEDRKVGCWTFELFEGSLNCVADTKDILGQNLYLCKSFNDNDSGKSFIERILA